MGDYAKAEPLYRRALEVREKALGAEHPGTAMSLNNLAELYKTNGEYAKAEPFLLRALAIREKALGPEHPDTATSLNNLAGLYRAMDDYAKAEPLLRRALAICEKTLGPEHPFTAGNLSNLAILDMDLGKAGDALEVAVRAGKSQETQLGNILSFTSEQQRLAFQETTNPFTLVATLGSARDIAQAILHNKGVVLDSILEDRLVAEASKETKQREVIDQLRGAKQRYTQLLMEVPKDFSAEARQRREAELEKRAAQVEELEATLAQQVSGLGRARRALSVTLAQVQGALTGDQVLVELLRYNHYLGKNEWERRYGALVIASKGEPRWVPLGAAAGIEKKVELYGKSVRGETDETTLHSVLRTLHDQVWAPIEKALPEGTKTVILSPDGDLNFVSFATLLSAADEFLIEKYSIGYVASGRDLLRERGPSATELLAVFGNSDFGSKAELIAQQTETSGPLAMRASEMGDFGNMLLKALPGTEKECAGLKAQAEASGKPIDAPWRFARRRSDQGIPTRRIASTT
jgi:tetratricopeptide (TPR) repeat protein